MTNSIVRPKQIIFIVTLFILSLQVFPVEGICYLLGVSVIENNMNDKFLCENEDGDKDEDPLKIKKIELLCEHSVISQLVSLQTVTQYNTNIKIGLPINHSVEILIPPPNVA